MRSDLLEPSRARGKKEREREPTDPETQTGREEGKKVRPTGEETDARGSPNENPTGRTTGAPCASDAQAREEATRGHGGYRRMFSRP